MASPDRNNLTKTVMRYTQPCVQTQPGLEFKVEEVELFEDPKGKWVRYDDIKHLLQVEPSGYRCEIDGPHFYECKHCHIGVPIGEPPADRKSALDEIVRISEEAGLYEDPPAKCANCGAPLYSGTCQCCATPVNRGAES